MDEPFRIFSDDPTEQFLLTCLQNRIHHDRMDLMRRAASAGDVDWQLFLEYVEGEKLSGLLYKDLEAVEAVPDQVREALRQAYDRNHTRNIVLLNELIAIQEDLQARNLAVVLLKGAALNLTIYADPGLRPLGDLDLLVQQVQFKSIVGELEQLGYEISTAEERPGSRQVYDNEITLYKPEHFGVHVEIHWSLLNSPYYQHKLPMDWFWQSASKIETSGVTNLVLGAKAQLIHLSAHIVLHHSGSELLWLNDIAELIARLPAGFDWEDLFQRAMDYDLLLPLKQTLQTLLNEWQLHIPAAALEALREMTPSAEEKQVFSSLIVAGRPVARRFIDDLYYLPGWRERMTFAWVNLFPSPAYMQRRYHIRHLLLLPFFYPYRWFLGLKSGL